LIVLLDNCYSIVASSIISIISNALFPLLNLSLLIENLLSGFLLYVSSPKFFYIFIRLYICIILQIFQIVLLTFNVHKHFIL